MRNFAGIVLMVLAPLGIACPGVESVPDGGSAAVIDLDGGADCEAVRVVMCADACSMYWFSGNRASNQPVTVPILIEGPESCLEVSVTSPAGLRAGTLRKRMSADLAEWEVEFVANVPGDWTIEVSRRGRPDVKASYRYFARAPPTKIVAPCWQTPRSCRHLYSSDGLVACDETLFAIDGGIVGELPDGGFFLGSVRFAAAEGRISPVTVGGSGLSLGEGVPLPRPVAWAVEGASLLVSSTTEARLLRVQDDGGLVAIAAPSPPGPTPIAFFLGEEHPVLTQSRKVLCDVASNCATGAPWHTPAWFHVADGRRVEFTYQQIFGVEANRVEYRDGRFVDSITETGPRTRGRFSFEEWIPRRGLYGEPEGFSADPSGDHVFSVTNAERFGASFDATWASTATESFVFCE